MNKQELLEQINGLSSTLLDKRVLVDKSAVLELIDKLDELQKVVIPRFVAEWLELRKSRGSHLHATINSMDEDELVGNWYYDDDGNPIDEKLNIISHAWTVGYEVEKEKLYTVEIPNPNSKGHNQIYLCKDDQTKKVFL